MWGSPFRMRPTLGDACPEDVVRRWYIDTSDERAGDMAIHPIDGNVVMVCCSPHESEEMTLSLHTYNPYASSFFLFYTYSDFAREVTVLGGLTWAALWRMGGRVKLTKDLVRNRTFPLVYERDGVLPPPKAGEGQSGGDVFAPPAAGRKHKWQWFLPLDLPRSPTYEMPSASIYDICHRMEWVLGSRLDPPPEDSTSPLTLSLFECTIEDARKRGEFCKRRLQMEKARFEQLFAGMSELDVLQMFIYNGMEEYMNEAMAEEPTTQDLYWFWVRYNSRSELYLTSGGAVPPALRAGGTIAPNTFPPSAGFAGAGGNVKPPTRVFRFGAEECPVPLPLYAPHGLVHITYKEIGAWAWHIFVMQTQKLAFRRVTLPETEDRWVNLLNDLLHGRDVWPMVPKRARVSTANPYRAHFGAAAAPQHQSENGFVLENVDMEDLATHAPPCVANCMSAYQFPKHLQRLRLLPILQESHIAAREVFAWFEYKNAAYPHTTEHYSDAKSRFAYEALWNARRGKTYCKNIVRDTLSNGANAPILVCPYAHLPDYKSACAPNERVGFGGPHNLIKRYLGRKKTREGAVAAGGRGEREME